MICDSAAKHSLVSCYFGVEFVFSSHFGQFVWTDRAILMWTTRFCSSTQFYYFCIISNINVSSAIWHVIVNNMPLSFEWKYKFKCDVTWQTAKTYFNDHRNEHASAVIMIIYFITTHLAFIMDAIEPRADKWTSDERQNRRSSFNLCYAMHMFRRINFIFIFFFSNSPFSTRNWLISACVCLFCFRIRTY